MCGILGELSYDSRLISSDRFSNLLALSSSRGPDETRVETVAENLRFGFNRLSILDLSSRASQPMWTPSGRYLIVFNGEIYNHFELRNKLFKKGKKLKSNGDSATLAGCLDEWGIQNTVQQLDGMFAIGIWDKIKSRLSLVRDFAGIKPLYYGWNGKTVVFASQYNQISRHPVFNNERINHKVLKLYLIQHFVPPPFGLIENTHSVYPGEIISFDINGNKDSNIYWDFPGYNKAVYEGKSALEDVENELYYSVKAELISDVPLGAFLSGGIDSPLICFNACKHFFKNFSTFSIGSDSYIHDESLLSELFAEYLGTKHHSIKMDGSNSIHALKEAVEASGEPLGDFSLLPTWQVSKLAKSKVTVALSGDGGDELFFGYDRFQSIAKNNWLWFYPYIIRYLIRGMDRMVFNDKYVNECVLSNTPAESQFGLHSRFPINLLTKLLPDLTSIPLPNNYTVYKYNHPKNIDELLYHIRRAEFYGMLQKTLAKVDRASMAHGLEVRVPFLKKTMIEKILSMGIAVHQPMKIRKKILFELFEKSFYGITPEKNKKGFSIPLTVWIRTAFKDSFYEILMDTRFCNSFGIKKRIMEKMLDDHILGRKDLKWPLFTLYSLAIWSNRGRNIA
ncbi:MAG: asparagine synthase (glutamine-hydrolyzing) [Candidatus Marinimicrobia bacterium]|nr:asparagine synthase (glutamine-hydrolyzing) [Candidatus Neomarinimicrobiota bacterium]|tara:strand:+ start:7197 stop:9059 length:1863 start_codon:yes stop_codon:yes gene_type:complete